MDRKHIMTIMTFVALLSKELRTRMRRERTIWLMIAYILVMGITGYLVVNNLSNSPNNAPGSIGLYLYYFLAILQLILIIFIIPAFTATAINGEKERQTYDLLMCSSISSMSLVAGKLVAGMTTALLLIGASVPLFSLILFFGGVAPTHLLILLLVYVVTSLLIGSFAMLCSTSFKRPAISTSIAYVCNLAWCFSPLMVIFLWRAITNQYPSSTQLPFTYMWSPFVAIASISTSAGTSGTTITLGTQTIPLWACYCVLSLLVAIFFIVLSISAARPPETRRRRFSAARKPLTKQAKAAA